MLRNFISSARAIAPVLVVTLGLAIAPLSAGQTYTVLYAFHGADGARPSDGVIFDNSGNLYGVTTKGGARNRGAVYQLSPQGGSWVESVLYSFGSKSQDGATPFGGLVLDAAGNLYGTTEHGGAFGAGTVFQLSNVGGTWTETILHSFGQGNDGAVPMASPSMDAAGNLFGTTNLGGANQNCGNPATSCGTVFELSPDGAGGWTYSVIHGFKGQGNDGYFPLANVTPDGLGNLYGTASQGGPYAGGIVFKLTPSGNQWTWSLVHPYGNPPNGHGPEGYYPYAGMIFDADGNMWNTTMIGGSHKGTIVKFIPNGSGGWKQLHPAGLGYPPYGTYAAGNMIADAAGNVYGTTVLGGSGKNGTIFVVSPTQTGWQETVLYNFTGTADGGYSDSPLVADQNGNLYGTAWYGGDTTQCKTGQPIPGCGVVFKLSPAPRR